MQRVVRKMKNTFKWGQTDRQTHTEKDRKIITEEKKINTKGPIKPKPKWN